MFWRQRQIVPPRMLKQHLLTFRRNHTAGAMPISRVRPTVDTRRRPPNDFSDPRDTATDLYDLARALDRGFFLLLRHDYSLFRKSELSVNHNFRFSEWNVFSVFRKVAT